MDDRNDTAVTYAGGITMLVGIWLAISSLLFNLSVEAFTSQMVAAVALILIGAAEMYTRSTWVSWLSALAGLWLVVSPMIFTVSTAAVWNIVLMGVLAIGIGIWDRNLVSSGLRTHTRG